MIVTPLFITSFIVYTTIYRYIFFTANGSKLISHIVKNFRPAVYRRQTSGLYRCLWPIRAAYRACIAVCGKIPPHNAAAAVGRLKCVVGGICSQSGYAPSSLQNVVRFVPVNSIAFVAVISPAFHWPITSSQFGGFWAFGLPNSTPLTFAAAMPSA